MKAKTGISLLVVACLIPGVSFAGSEAAPGEGPTANAKGFVPPQIILATQKQPEYPPAAFQARFTGSVVLEMTVQKDGSVGEAAVIHCTRPKVGFEDAAIAAVKQWRFEPGTKDGDPVEVSTRLKLNFTRVGAGPAAQPQVSAGTFTTELKSGDTDTATPPRMATTSSPPEPR